MRLRRPIAFILSAAVAASALTGCDSFSGHAAAAANSAQVQQLIEFIADLGLERDLRQALQSGGDLRQALLTLLGLENAVNFNVDDLAGARPGQHAVQVWEVTAQSAEDAAALAASQIRAVLEQLKSNGVTAGRIGMVEVDGKYYIVVDVEVTEENTFEPIRPASDGDDDSDDDDSDDDDSDDDDSEDGTIPGVTVENGLLIVNVAELGLSQNINITATEIINTINEKAKEQTGEAPNYNKDSIKVLDLSGCMNLTSIGNPGDVYGSGAFQGCESLKTVILPTSLESIGRYAFYGCSSLTSIDLSNTSVDTIRHSTFAFCHGLTEVELPMDLATIEGDTGGTSTYGAFERCDGLKHIYFYSVPKIGLAAFYGVITDDRTLTIHCPNNIRDALQEKLTQSGSFTADDFTGDKIEFADIAPLTYLFGF